MHRVHRNGAFGAHTPRFYRSVGLSALPRRTRNGNICAVPTPSKVKTARLPVLAMLLALFAVSCGGSSKATVEALGEPGAAPAQYRVRVVAEFPHDTAAFTQGLVWADDGELYESTGRRGKSSLRRVDIASGEVLQVHELAAEYFGEGLARIEDELFQITWQEGTAFVYDASGFETRATYNYQGEGWGLCFDERQLVMSDGSSTLTFRDPANFEPIGEVRVMQDGQSLTQLNELECVGDRVYANVLGDDHIYEIDPTTGEVTAVVDASALGPQANEASAVLNGIAYSPKSGHFYLTGKNWPTLYEVTFEPT